MYICLNAPNWKVQERGLVVWYHVLECKEEMTHIALDHVMEPYEQLLSVDLDRLQGYAHLPVVCVTH